MLTISCSGKLWSFALAEQMEKRGMLDIFYTSYASQKNDILRHFARRMDDEVIPVMKIRTRSILAFPIKLWPSHSFQWNNMFDQWVASKLEKDKGGRIFIGWSGMSLDAIRTAKKNKMITILERGSAHIEYQDEILREEYAKHGLRFKSNPLLICKEKHEYEEADYIAVPSQFVKRSFVDRGIPERKIFVNPYGVNLNFTKNRLEVPIGKNKFRIIYLGSLSFRKGIPYLFDALKLINIPQDKYDMIFIGKTDAEFAAYCDRNKQPNWKFLGHIDHSELPGYLHSADLGVIPSVEDGFAMVIPQIMASGIPVITTYNTGAYDMIRDGENGYVVQIRNPQEIANRIELFYSDPELLAKCKAHAAQTVLAGYTWDDYGKRYEDFLNAVVA